MGHGDSLEAPGRLAGAPLGREGRAASRHGGIGAAGLVAARVVAPIVASRGGGVLARLKAAWTAIAGDDLAAIAWPEALGRDGTLKLRVVPNRALELQHRAPLVIEHINAYFGRAAVARLTLRQGAPPLAPPSRPAPPAPLDRREDAALAARLAAVADPQLREALLGLGRAVLAADRRERQGVAIVAPSHGSD